MFNIILHSQARYRFKRTIKNDTFAIVFLSSNFVLAACHVFVKEKKGQNGRISSSNSLFSHSKKKMALHEIAI